MKRQPTVAVFGTGIMGLPMAANLVRAGMTVRGLKRGAAEAESLAAHGIEVMDSASRMVTGADFVVTILPDGPVTHAVLEPVVAELPVGAVWLQMGTVGPEWTNRLAALAEQSGVGFVDAPLLGTKPAAEQGTLIVLGSGEDRLRDRVRPILESVGGRIMWIGAAGAGSKLKLVVNAWMLALVNATAESVALAETSDLDPKLFLDAIAGSEMDVPLAHFAGEGIIGRRFSPNLAAHHAVKDAELMLEVAGKEVDLAGIRATLTHLETAVQAGHGDDDVTALYYGVTPQ
ncbi:NAD(P)-dependent oxidoreductase [Nocardia arthritidis]|uniref:NAD-binding protein n=1 Tax=Nocardia arthritidis TaxID=228602 RepID=A0A6G9YM43_9NOCA|nr:NAD(P)-dependent oxidoreductase [Nocardia arthritidis]QIS13993.1 NAD-binding protein [Nocardia arthritidis]